MHPGVWGGIGIIVGLVHLMFRLLPLLCYWDFGIGYKDYIRNLFGKNDEADKG